MYKSVILRVNGGILRAIDAILGVVDAMVMPSLGLFYHFNGREEINEHEICFLTVYDMTMFDDLQFYAYSAPVTAGGFCSQKQAKY